MRSSWNSTNSASAGLRPALILVLPSTLRVPGTRMIRSALWHASAPRALAMRCIRRSMGAISSSLPLTTMISDSRQNP